MEKRKDTGRGIKLAVLFLFGVICLVFVTIVFRIGALFASSTFDAKHQYILKIQQDATHQTFLVANPDTKTINVVKIVGKNQDQDGSPLIAIPWDAQITASYTANNPVTFYQTLPIRLAKYEPRKITVIDASHLYLFAQGVSSSNIATQTFTLDSLTTNSDAMMSTLLQDRSLYQEGQSIAISNGSTTPGLGNRLAKLLTTIGANVISVTTADKPVKNSTIVYVDEKTYTVSRLERLLEYGLVPSHKTSSLADIIITLGEDANKNKEF